MTNNEKSDLRQMACDEPEPVWSIANKADDALQDYLLRVLKEENPEWYFEKTRESEKGIEW